MNKLYYIFDYFKEAFHINKNNKSIYRPQIIFILLKLILIVGIGIRIYTWIGSPDIYSLDEEKLFSIFFTYGAGIFGLLLLYSLISILIDSGIYNMYKKSVTIGMTSMEDFREGIRKYFFKFLLGQIIILFSWIIISPIYFIFGFITLFLGFTLIPIIVNLFLTMWRISLVMNDWGIFQSFRDSFRFASKNFLPLTVLQFIHWAFVKGSALGSSGSRLNLPNGINTPAPSPNMPFTGNPSSLETALRIIKTVVAIAIPVITIAALVASLIRMIFGVFFSLVLFIAYRDRFTANTEGAKEVIS